MTTTTLAVRGASPYDVLVGHRLLGRLPGLLGPSVEKVALLHDSTVTELAQPAFEALVADYDVLALGLPPGEQTKAVAAAAECWDALGEAGFTRSDAVVTFGGGATTDLGGFVAATWLRGVRAVHVPTTLLGMVDAAVGGKTGINVAAGKNLVGSFHEPAGVICDLETLRTLPRADLIAGLGEVIKCGFIADPVILELIEGTDPASLDAGSPVLRELVERAIRVKIDVVESDLRESAGDEGHPGRASLNYGHTMAHAIERASGYTMRHGEAVALGCVYVAELAVLAERLDRAVADRHRAALERLGLPTVWGEASFDDLMAGMRMDKKARGSTLRFVVLDDEATPRMLVGPSDEQLRAAYDVLAGTAGAA